MEALGCLVGSSRNPWFYSEYKKRPNNLKKQFQYLITPAYFISEDFGIRRLLASIRGRLTAGLIVITPVSLSWEILFNVNIYFFWVVLSKFRLFFKILYELHVMNSLLSINVWLPLLLVILSSGLERNKTKTKKVKKMILLLSCKFSICVIYLYDARLQRIKMNKFACLC